MTSIHKAALQHARNHLERAAKKAAYACGQYHGNDQHDEDCQRLVDALYAALRELDRLADKAT